MEIDVKKEKSNESEKSHDCELMIRPKQGSKTEECAVSFAML